MINEEGILTLEEDKVPPGTYFYSIEASIGEFVETLDFSLFIRDLDFKIPLPTENVLQSNITSLIYMESYIPGLSIVYDPLGIVKIIETG